ncbi:MAG: ankyrin repeat domain-containing protein [Crocinitomicaceae bacterium]|nr:ankyrin repeat domain-containing protein [Crocinitomicaceae bacterium]
MINYFSKFPILLISILLFSACSEESEENESSEYDEVSVNSGMESEVPSYDDIIYTIDEEGPNELKSLIEQGADVNAQPSWEYKTPLITASENGSLEMVKLLVENGADISASAGEFDYYMCPVGPAFNGKYLDIQEYYVEQGVDINEFQPVWYIHPDNEKIVQYLLGKGMDVNAKRAMGVEWYTTRLSYALYNTEFYLAEYLLSIGAEMDKETAMSLNTVDAFNPLIDAGVDFSSVDDQIGETVGEPSIYSILS